ncbi:helix-turn-helix domain-containing protein [Halosquirtibacter xylanolyticus]|uniref:helix-turn-helix domain-containing protein n=1 Tax=Halosquirtibacter xylanolyticus TaxID=3374599 RepID=UPI00374A79C7|nr:helix-turn-helix domain-containing protein [Prolixibacteraceae bacterium]
MHTIPVSEKKVTTIFCDINTKKWLSLEEAITYLGFGSKDLFRRWRENGVLTYYKLGKRIVYKRADIDKYIESCRIIAFNQ